MDEPLILSNTNDYKSEDFQQVFLHCGISLFGYICSIDLYAIIKSGLLGNDNEWKQILTIKERLKLYTNKQDIKYRINTFYNRYNIDIEKTLTNQTFNIWDIDIDQNDDKRRMK